LDNTSEIPLAEGTTTSEENVMPNSLDRKNKWLMPLLVVFVVLLIDQMLKIWIKTSMDLNQEKRVIGNWFLLHFTENPGMAFGLELGGKYGKLFLTVFRIIAVFFGVWVLKSQLAKNAHKGFILCIALILAGAIGNIIDSVFYGVIFSEINHYSGGWFHGWVVDMLYFPMIEGHYPEWLPWKGGQYFIFFSPVFNFADTAISLGVFAILIFQKKFFPKEHEPKNEEPLSSQTPEFQSEEESINPDISEGEDEIKEDDADKS